MKKAGVFLLIMSSLSFIPAQSLSSHRWQDRLILIFSSEKHHPLLQQQLQLLKAQGPALEDRKLVVYHIRPTTAQQRFPQAGEEKARDNAYLKRRFPAAAFEIQLIGLDGGIKSASQEVVDPQALFDLIDTMPMRQAEVRRRKG